MPVNRKALLEDIQKVLQEHEVGSAVVNLDLFSTENVNGDGKESEGPQQNGTSGAPTTGTIEIYLEEHVDAPRSGLARGDMSGRDRSSTGSFSRSNATAKSGSTVSLPPTSCRGAENGNPDVSKKNSGSREDGRGGQEGHTGVVLPPAVTKYSQSASPPSPKKSLSSTGSSTLPPFLQKDAAQLDEIRRVHAKEVAEKEREAERLLPVATMFPTPPPRLPPPSPEENSNPIVRLPRSFGVAEEDEMVRTNAAGRDAGREEEDATRQPKESKRSGVEATTMPLPGLHEETHKEKDLTSAKEETGPPQLQFSDDVLQMLGLGGGGGGHHVNADGTESDAEISGFELDQKRAERTQLLKSWVGKSTLLDYSKAKEKAEKDPPRQFLSQKLSKTPPLPAVLRNDNLASSKVDGSAVLGKESWLPPHAPSDSAPQDNTDRKISGTSPAPPRSTSTTSKDTLNYLRQPSPPAPLAPSTATLPNKSLREMLAEQRAAEANNKVGLQNHAKIMKECKEYLNEIENDPEKSKMVEVVHNPLTKKRSDHSCTPNISSTSQQGVPQQAGSSVEEGKKAAMREQLDCIAIPAENMDIKIEGLTLPDNPEGREAVIKQFLSSPDGRALLSQSSVKFDAIRAAQTKESELCAEKEKSYKQLLEAALRYNESLGVKVGKP